MASKETQGSGAPIQPSAKSAKAEPQVNSDMEMGALGNDHAEEPKAELDIMQFARTGDIPSMEKLFEDKEFDATYCDEEGITALHVRSSSHALSSHKSRSTTANLCALVNSGLRSTTNMPCASTSSKTAPR